MIDLRLHRTANMSIDELFLRQQRLLARSSQLRLDVADVIQGLKKPLAMADTAHACFKWLRQNPLIPSTALLLLLFLHPHRIVSWGGRVWWMWKLFKRLKALVNGRLK